MFYHQGAHDGSWCKRQIPGIYRVWTGMKVATKLGALLDPKSGCWTHARHLPGIQGHCCNLEEEAWSITMLDGISDYHLHCHQRCIMIGYRQVQFSLNLYAARTYFLFLPWAGPVLNNSVFIYFQTLSFFSPVLLYSGSYGWLFLTVSSPEIHPAPPLVANKQHFQERESILCMCCKVLSAAWGLETGLRAEAAHNGR